MLKGTVTEFIMPKENKKFNLIKFCMKETDKICLEWRK